MLRAMDRIRGLRRLLQLRVVRGVAAHSRLLQLNVRCRGCKTVRCWAVEDCVSRPTVCRADRWIVVKRESNSFSLLLGGAGAEGNPANTAKFIDKNEQRESWGGTAAVNERLVVEFVREAVRQLTASIGNQREKRGIDVPSSKRRGFVLDGCFVRLAGNSVAGNPDFVRLGGLAAPACTQRTPQHVAVVA